MTKPLNAQQAAYIFANMTEGESSFAKSVKAISVGQHIVIDRARLEAVIEQIKRAAISADSGYAIDAGEADEWADRLTELMESN